MMFRLNPCVFALALLLPLASVRAQALGPGETRVEGTITSIAGNHTVYQCTDRFGNTITVLINKNTRYHLGNADADLQSTLFVGDDVRATLNVNGVAIDVYNRNRGRVMAAALRPDLGSTDEEWRVISPLLSKVIDLQRAATGRGQSDLRVAVQNVRNALRDTNASPYQIEGQLKALRAVRAKMRADLAAAQSALIAVLTQRQEAKLVQLGVLD